MPKLPDVSGKEARRALERLGFVFKRQSGSHVIMRRGNRGCVVPMHREISRGKPSSGMIESGHRHVLQARLKKAGTAWLPDHADQIAHLRVLRVNHQWASLWN